MKKDINDSFIFHHYLIYHSNYYDLIIKRILQNENFLSNYSLEDNVDEDRLKQIREEINNNRQKIEDLYNDYSTNYIYKWQSLGKILQKHSNLSIATKYVITQILTNYYMFSFKIEYYIKEKIKLEDLKKVKEFFRNLKNEEEEDEEKQKALLENKNFYRKEHIPYGMQIIILINYIINKDNYIQNFLNTGDLNVSCSFFDNLCDFFEWTE